MNILITGASGFIGNNLINKLLQENHNIYGIDLCDSDIENKNYIHFTIDISESNWTTYLNINIDVIIHLAQSLQYRNFPEGSLNMLAVNVNSTLELLEWARKNNVTEFIFTSTGNVYKPSSKLLKETDICYPASMYASTKLSAEYLVQQYSDFFDIIILRIFGVYGPGQENMLIPNIINKIKNQQEITLAKGKGIFLTPMYIDDCVKIINKIIITNKLKKKEIINLSGNSIINIKDMIDTICNYLDITPITKITDDEPVFLLGDSSKIRKLFPNFEFINFREGIIKTIK